MGMSSLAQAAPLNLVLNPAPDIFSSFIDVNYNSSTDILAASGFAFTLDDDGIGTPLPIAGGTFDLAASVLDDGTLAGGSLAIGGTVAGLGFNSGTLLTGSLSAIGFPDAGGDPLEFLFDVTGGDAAGLYGGAGGLGGIILGFTGFDGDWTTDFRSAPFNAVADVGTVGVVPIPAAIWLFGTALLGLVGFSKRRKAA
jgi:hypothetical protein